MADKEEIVLSKETCALLQEQAPVCTLCRWILEDFSTNGKLTTYPLMYDQSGMFPVAAKVKHVQLEKASKENKNVGTKRKAST